MNITSKIQKDKELEQYFLKYLRTYFLKAKFEYYTPSPKTEEEIQLKEKVHDEVYNAFLDILKKLGLKHNILIDNQENFDRAMTIIVDVSDYYLSMFSFDEILDMTDKYFKNNDNLSDTPLLKDLLQSKMSICSKCGTKRDKVRESKIPPEMLNQIIEEKIDVEYYLHCTNCNEYTMIIKE
nr:hypothetical protein [uncultured Carboxylicivirga sp.]